MLVISILGDPNDVPSPVWWEIWIFILTVICCYSTVKLWKAHQSPSWDKVQRFRLSFVAADYSISACALVMIQGGKFSWKGELKYPMLDCWEHCLENPENCHVTVLVVSLQLKLCELAWVNGWQLLLSDISDDFFALQWTLSFKAKSLGFFGCKVWFLQTLEISFKLSW